MSAYQAYDHPRQPGLGAHDVASPDFMSAPLTSVPGTFHDGANPLLEGVPPGPSLFDLRQHHPYDHGRHYQPVPQLAAYRHHQQQQQQHYQLDAMRAAGPERPRQPPHRMHPSLPPLSIPPPLPSIQNHDALASPPQDTKSEHPAEVPPTALLPQAREDQKRNREADEDSQSDSEESRSRKTTTGRKRIMIQYIQEKSRRHITFSKRKAGIMKKRADPLPPPPRPVQAFELSTLTGTQVLLLVVSETGLVYTFATPKLQPIVTRSEGKNLIQACLNGPDYPLTPPQEVQTSLVRGFCELGRLIPRTYPGSHPVTPVNPVNPGFYDNLPVSSLRPNPKRGRAGIRTPALPVDRLLSASARPTLPGPQFGDRPQQYTPISAESPTSSAAVSAAHGTYGSYPGTYR
ncbi:MAG: hypothetical protein BJ554DRAFT_2559 [Olpidium bornovanus]|uniref:MADS-box domain-containing protein n=1 Tax=Olpidium bornovanus TaxID=278681 RepID=A0A8H8DGJ8_9FUNG|nr:MAG: hypothetical protein BJ554DRAFT_2559 [Olpidium bornovanus]